LIWPMAMNTSKPEIIAARLEEKTFLSICRTKIILREVRVKD
jgi:hypothetical protein